MGARVRAALRLMGGAAAILLWSGSVERAAAQQPARPGGRVGMALLTGPRELRVDAGETLTLAVRLPAGIGRDALEVRAPRGWTVVPTSGAAPGAAGAGSRPSVQLVSLAVPGRARAGAYVVRLRLRGRAAADSATLHVAERRRVAVRLVSAADITAAGDPFVATFALSNDGNADVRLRLAAWGSGASRARLSLDSTTLAPGEARTVEIRLPTVESAVAERIERVELRAHVAGTDSVAARAAASTTVTPRSSARSASGLRLPLRLTARSGTIGSAATAPGGSSSLEIAGGVALDPRGTTRLDLLARVTGARQSPFAERDEFRLEYRGERVRVRAGDHFFGLSSLTEPGRGLFGLALGATAGPVDVQAFTARDRRTSSGISERGGRIDVRLPLGATIGGTTLEVRGRDSGVVAGGAASLRPAEWLQVELEAARRVDGVDGAGRTLRLHATQPWYSMSLGHVGADSAFVGPWRATRRSWASLVLRPFRRVALEGSWTDADRSPGGTSALAGSTGLRHAALRAGPVRAAYRWRERRRTWLGETRDGREESAELSMRQELGALTVDAGVAAGAVALSPSLARPRFWRIDGGVTARLGRGALASASADLVDGPTLDAPRASRQLTTQASLRLPWSSSGNLQLRALHRRRDYPEDRFTMLDGWIEQRLPFGHVATIRARAVRGSALLPDDVVAQFEYAVPLSVPLPGRSDGGTVVGHVVDAETGRSLPGMRVELGRRAVVTDDAGRFVFHDVEPGPTYVTLDRRSLGSDRTVVTREAIPMIIEAGKRARVELPVARTSALAGRLDLFGGGMPTAGDEGPSPSQRLGGADGALVLLVREGETRQARTDADGRFVLAGLAPGRWRLLVAEESLPEHHHLERDSVDVHLAPGEHRSLELRVVPRRRAVRIVAEAELTVEGSSGTPGRARAGDAGGAGRRDPGTSAQVADGAREHDALQGHYTVTRWDVGLADIALKVYGDARLWPKIYLASRSLLGNPDVVPTGVRLRIPRKAALTPEERAVAAAHRARWEARSAGRRSPGARVPPHLQGFYTVTHWDVGLADIALKVYGDATLWPKIWLASRDLLADPSLVVPGVRLRVPLKAPLTPEERAAAAEYGGSRAPR